jgi:hypothetical protein
MWNFFGVIALAAIVISVLVAVIIGTAKQY